LEHESTIAQHGLAMSATSCSLCFKTGAALKWKLNQNSLLEVTPGDCSVPAPEPFLGITWGGGRWPGQNCTWDPPTKVTFLPNNIPFTNLAVAGFGRGREK